MLSDSEVEVDKQFAIRNNIVDKLKEDIFIPKTYTNHLSEKKRIKQKKYSEEDIENEIDNKFFYDNFLVNLNHSKEKVDANKINIFNSQKKIHTKKQKLPRKVKTNKEKINANKIAIKSKHKQLKPIINNIENDKTNNNPPVSSNLKDKITIFKLTDEIRENVPKTEMIKISKQKSRHSLSFIPIKTIDKKYLCIDNGNKLSSANRSNMSCKKEKSENSCVLSYNNNVNKKPTNNKSNKVSINNNINNNSDSTKKNEEIVPKKKKGFSLLCCIPFKY